MDSETIEQAAASVLARHLGMLVHPDGQVLALVQYRHSSPFVLKTKHRIAEAILETLRTNGYAITKADPNQPVTDEMRAT